MIKSGEKKFEYRDGHITFINEDTQESLKMEVIHCEIIPWDELPEDLKNSDFLKDEWIIKFELETTRPIRDCDNWPKCYPNTSPIGPYHPECNTNCPYENRRP